MVGVVIVSHSAKVAEGTKEIAEQMVGGELQIIACGGDQKGGIGTDPDRIRAAISMADQGEGVVVLADLGSAVLSVGLILDSLPAKQKQRVQMADAPLVEGTVIAAVESALGKNLRQVLAGAREAKFLEKTEDV